MKSKLTTLLGRFRTFPSYKALPPYSSCLRRTFGVRSCRQAIPVLRVYAGHFRRCVLLFNVLCRGYFHVVPPRRIHGGRGGGGRLRSARRRAGGAHREADWHDVSWECLCCGVSRREPWIRTNGGLCIRGSLTTDS